MPPSYLPQTSFPLGACELQPLPILRREAKCKRVTRHITRWLGQSVGRPEVPQRTVGVRSSALRENALVYVHICQECSCVTSEKLSPELGLLAAILSPLDPCWMVDMGS